MSIQGTETESGAGAGAGAGARTKAKAKVSSLRIKDLTDNTVFLISEKESYITRDLTIYTQFRNRTMLKTAILCYIYEDNKLRKVRDDEHLAYKAIPIAKYEGRLSKEEIAKEYEKEKEKEEEKEEERRRLYIELDIYRDDLRTHYQDRLETRTYLVGDPIPLVELQPLVTEPFRIYDITTLYPSLSISKAGWERKSAVEKWDHYIGITPNAQIKDLSGFDDWFTGFMIMQADTDTILEVTSYSNVTWRIELKAGWYLLRGTSSKVKVVK